MANALYEVDTKLLIALECGLVAVSLMLPTVEIPNKASCICGKPKISKEKQLWRIMVFSNSVIFKQALSMGKCDEAIRAVSISTLD